MTNSWGDKNKINSRTPSTVNFVCYYSKMQNTAHKWTGKLQLQINPQYNADACYWCLHQSSRCRHAITLYMVIVHFTVCMLWTSEPPPPVGVCIPPIGLSPSATTVFSAFIMRLLVLFIAGKTSGQWKYCSSRLQGNHNCWNVFTADLWGLLGNTVKPEKWHWHDFTCISYSSLASWSSF